MSNLERKTYHDCKTPTVEDRSTEHRWRCDVCQTRWTFYPQIYPGYKRRVSAGFLGLGSRLVEVPAKDRGYWHHEPRDPWWVAVEPKDAS